MVSSYTANLAMFLVIENKVPKIKSVEDLKDCGNEGGFCPVNFGAKKDGATFGFFKVNVGFMKQIICYLNHYFYLCYLLVLGVHR